MSSEPAFSAEAPHQVVTADVPTAERAHSLQIVVEESNRQARSFYRRSGFVPVEPELLELVLPRVD